VARPRRAPYYSALVPSEERDSTPAERAGEAPASTGERALASGAEIPGDEAAPAPGMVPSGEDATRSAPAAPNKGDEAVRGTEGTVPANAETPARRGRRLALSTAFFSFATGLSRVAGLAREVIAAGLFGVSAAMSAFTIAFQVPNLVRALVADAALQGAFVPVFTELLERGERREAFRVASGLLFLLTLALGALTAVFILAAPALIPLVAPGFSPALDDLTIALARIMFPIVVLLAVSGLVVGMLNSFEHFSVPALAPLAWNLVIIGALVGLTPVFPEGEEIYAYAVGILAGTVVQLVLPMPWLRGRGGRITLTLGWRNPAVWRVLKLMLPVTIALGLINFSLLINSVFGTLVSDEAPAAIDKAFRIYMLPQGLFSVAVATILFPTLSRLAARGERAELRATMANGVRGICLLLFPSAALIAVLAEPITRLVYQRGAFGPEATDLVALALFWWAFSLPFQGVSLLFSRTFFSLQRPWVTTAIAGANLVVNALVALALYEALGVAGIVIGTVVATVAMTVAQGFFLRPDLQGIDGARTLAATLRMLLAAAGLAVVALLIWTPLDAALGRALPAQAASLGVAIAAGLAVYAAAVWVLRVPEARQVAGLVRARVGRGE
jgi:putative peptidoglycan lipid II flippase